MSSAKDSVLVKAAIASLATYAAFRASRAATAPDVPSKFSAVAKGQGESEEEGGKVRVALQDMPADELCRKYLPTYNGVMTTWSLFKATATKFASNPFHGSLNPQTKEWSWETYGQVLSDVELIGRGMERLGLLSNAKNDSSMRVFALFGPNCSNWVKCEYAAVSRSATTVTLYATLTQEGIAHVLNLTGVESVACASKDCAKRCIETKGLAPTLKTVIVTERSEDLERLASAAGVRLLALDDVRLAGREPMPTNDPNPSNIFTFCFTSGSTGLPKGALISHSAFVVNVAATSANVQIIPVLKEGEGRYLSFLPLAHQMERVTQCLQFSWGSRIGFSRGDPALIMEDVALLRPTFFATVPRLLTRLYDGIRTKANAAGGIKTKLFNQAMASKLYDLAEYHHLAHPIWDKLVFAKIKKQIGLDACDIVVTGSAPVAPRVLDFLRCVLSCRVVEGYGQTEGTCTVSLTHPLHVGGPEERQSHVGGPVPCVQIKLISVPEMQYMVTDKLHDGRIPVIGRGQVLVRGPCVMNGYFSLPEKTAQTIDKDGWLYTGDVGAWLPDGTLTIIDRASNIFKTAQGEYCQPEKIERAICRVPVIASAFVFGTTLNSKLVAIVVLNPEALPQYCKAKGVEQTDLAKLKTIITSDVKAACHEAGLLGFEIPSALNLQTKPFTIDSGVLTATSKLVRGVAKQFFKNELTELYKEVGEEVKIL